MANPNRKMCTLRRIDDVRPIEGADRIELAVIGGWQVVVSKSDGFKPGDICAYFEIDTFLPFDDDRYKGFQSEHPKEMVVDGKSVMGTVLRTRKFRGVYSQGLCLWPECVLPESIPGHAFEQMCDEGMDVSKLANVWEYVPLAPMDKGLLGKYDESIAPRTDAERVQNVSQETWDLIRRTIYVPSLKVDGMSISMLWDDRTGGMRYFAHNSEFDMSRHGIQKVVAECAERQGLTAFCESNHMVTLQAELVGPKVESNRLGLEGHRLMVFSIWNVMQARYISPIELGLTGRVAQAFDISPILLGSLANWQGVADSLVPMYSDTLLDDFERPQDFLAWVDGIKGNVTKGRLDEGVVVHIYDKGSLSIEEWLKLHNDLGPTLQVKAVSNKYILKAKD